MDNITLSDNTQIQYGSFAKTVQQIEMYSNLIIIPVGILLNLVCVITFIKSKISSSPTGLHLTCLAVADNVILLSMFAVQSESWSQYIEIHDLYNIGSLTCYGVFYFLTMGFLWSGLLLASATIERFLSVGFPLKIQVWNLYPKSKFLMVLYFVLSVVLPAYSAFCVEYNVLDNFCHASEKSLYVHICFYGDIIVSIALSNCICSTLILLFTILTSIQLFKLKKKRLDMGSESQKEFQIAAMLLIVALFFIILRIPEMILFQVIYYFNTEEISNSLSRNIKAIYPIFIVCVTINHSINFIYCTFFKGFKQTFVEIFVICIQLRREAHKNKTIDHSVSTVTDHVEFSNMDLET